MFWSSVWGGLGMLAHWQTYVGLAVLALAPVFSLLVYVLPMLLTDKGKLAAVSAGTGCVVGSVLRFTFHAVLLALVVTWLMPLMLGREASVPLGLLWQAAGGLLRIGLLAAVAVFLLSLLPLVGGLLHDLPGASQFVQGIIIVHLFLGFLVGVGDVPKEALESAVPGFVATVGFFVFAAVLGLVGLVVVSVIRELLADRFLPYYGSKEEGSSPLVAATYGAVASMFPLFMYVSYIGRSLQRG